VCAKYKPDRTISSEASSDQSAAASAKGSIFGGSASAASASAEKTERQALSTEQLEKDEKIYKACLFYQSGDMEEEAWKRAIAEYMGQDPPEEKKSLAERAVSALAGQAKPGKKKKSQSAQMKPAPSPCGRYTHLKIHVPSRYTQKSCRDEPPKKGRLVFHSTQGKAGTCKLISSWAGMNSFAQVSVEHSGAKDTLVFSKSGFPNMTVRCVNTPKDSGKPTRLVFILDR
jgi:hypothetical protein